MSSREGDPTVALRASLRRHLGFGDTRSHSRFVQRSKWILPGLAGTLLLLVATWPQLKSVIDHLHFAVPRIDLSDARNLRMLDPRYTGIDRENRPYVLTASSATQTAATVANLRTRTVCVASAPADVMRLNGWPCRFA